jgi:hypothetical protein
VLDFSWLVEDYRQKLFITNNAAYFFPSFALQNSYRYQWWHGKLPRFRCFHVCKLHTSISFVNRSTRSVCAGQRLEGNAGYLGKMLGIWIFSIRHGNCGGSKDPTISDSVIKEKARRRLEEKSSESVYTYGIINPKKGTELACVGQPLPIRLLCISTSKPKLSTLTNLNEPPRGKEILASSFTPSTSSDCWRSKEVLLVDVSRRSVHDDVYIENLTYDPSPVFLPE